MAVGVGSPHSSDYILGPICGTFSTSCSCGWLQGLCVLIGFCYQATNWHHLSLWYINLPACGHINCLRQLLEHFWMAEVFLLAVGCWRGLSISWPECHMHHKHQKCSSWLCIPHSQSTDPTIFPEEGSPGWVSPVLHVKLAPLRSVSWIFWTKPLSRGLLVVAKREEDSVKKNSQPYLARSLKKNTLLITLHVSETMWWPSYSEEHRTYKDDVIITGDN